VHPVWSLTRVQFVCAMLLDCWMYAYIFLCNEQSLLARVVHDFHNLIPFGDQTSATKRHYCKADTQLKVLDIDKEGVINCVA
jgi:hypothetical protein